MMTDMVQYMIKVACHSGIARDMSVIFIWAALPWYLHSISIFKPDQSGAEAESIV